MHSMTDMHKRKEYPSTIVVCTCICALELYDISEVLWWFQSLLSWLLYNSRMYTVNSNGYETTSWLPRSYSMFVSMLSARFPEQYATPNSCHNPQATSPIATTLNHQHQYAWYGTHYASLCGYILIDSSGLGTRQYTAGWSIQMTV